MSRRTPERRALPLVDAIYAAATHPPAWTTFLELLSADLGGAAIAMSVMLPGFDLPPEYYRIHLREEFVPAFERLLRRGLPWPMTHALFRKGFARGSALFPDKQVASTAYYRDYLEPQGIAPEGPIAHLIVASDERPVSGISIQRRVGGRRLSDEDLATCNLLVPHLATATTLRHERVRAHQQRHARNHLLDRFRVGIVILDATRRAIVTNRSAQAILAAQDGLYERTGILHATSARDEWELQHRIREAIGVVGAAADAPGSPGDALEPRYLTVGRPSGKTPYALLIWRLLSAPIRSEVGDEVAAIFITDTAPGELPHAENFRYYFGLTRAESEVVSLLAAGLTPVQISRRRGVELGTTRTQLKRIFAKTRASGQAELMRLALADDVLLELRDPED